MTNDALSHLKEIRDGFEGVDSEMEDLLSDIIAAWEEERAERDRRIAELERSLREYPEDNGE